MHMHGSLSVSGSPTIRDWRAQAKAHGGGVAGLAGRKLQEYLVQPGPWAVVLELRAHRQDCKITVPAQPISSRAHECAAGLTREPLEERKDYKKKIMSIHI